MLILRTCYKSCLFSTILFLTCIFLNAGCVSAEISSGNSNAIKSNTVKSAVNVKLTEKAADDLFYKGLAEKNQALKETYLTRALAKYMFLLSIQPNNAIYCTQVGVIHDLCGHGAQAKAYFYRAINLDKLNPFANFYFGEYYFNMKDYRNALKYYLIAFNNGYGSYYEVNNRLAIVYEKLGDLQKAKDYYTISTVVNPNQTHLNKKIRLLDNVYYNKDEYTKSTVAE